LKRIPIFVLNAIAFIFILFGLHTLLTSESAEIPKNVIIMISDGCGYNHIDAANMYQYGKTGVQAFEKFPVRYAMSTYSEDGEGYDPDQAWKQFDYVKKKFTDSAAAITAISTGVKTRNEVVGLDKQYQSLEHIFERGESLGKSTGVVTSVRLCDATPAGMVTHNEYRKNYLEISKEMILNSPLEVIMGCGHPCYDDNGNSVDSSFYEFKYVGGKDTWEGLIHGDIKNDSDGDGLPDPWHFIEDRSEFQKLMTGQTPKRVIGIPKVEATLQEGRKGDSLAVPNAVPFIVSVPTLYEMTTAALNVLDNNPDGFFIMIEGGAVDWASHHNESGRMIEEQIDFHNAVNAVIAWVEKQSSWDETLLIVTADHECGYLTGPGSGSKHASGDETTIPVWNPLKNNGRGKLPGMEWHSTKHTNSLVPFFAKGIGCELFQKYANRKDPIRGKFIDNTDIARILFSFFKKIHSQQNP
jgi:alkaline phosphatase